MSARHDLAILLRDFAAWVVIYGVVIGFPAAIVFGLLA